MWWHFHIIRIVDIVSLVDVENTHTHTYTQIYRACTSYLKMHLYKGPNVNILAFSFLRQRGIESIKIISLNLTLEIKTYAVIVARVANNSDSKMTSFLSSDQVSSRKDKWLCANPTEFMSSMIIMLVESNQGHVKATAYP